MKLEITITDETGDISDLSMEFDEHDPMVLGFKLLQGLLVNRLDTEIKMATVFAGAASVGLDTYLADHYGRKLGVPGSPDDIVTGR